ncbi:MAG TPA: hypothetical protein VNM38_08160 [Solirubrobacterales bacterium]|nr:hypothetical protein [Solirubrobacterales bacterium]
MLALVGLVPVATAEVVQKQGVRVQVHGDLLPQRLPRHDMAPIAVSISAQVGSAPSLELEPQLQRIVIAINSFGRLRTRGLPRCRYGHINPSTTQEAIEACGSALVGEGHFSADVRLPEQSPFPSEGKVLAFNGLYKGRPALFAHIYGTEPIPTSFVLPFLLRSSDGTYGTVLEASLPQVTGNWGFVKGLSMTLRRTFTFRGRQMSYLSASCPAPGGLTVVPFPLARTGFVFAGGPSMSIVVTDVCRVKRP